jgi:hypothetical protein
VRLDPALIDQSVQRLSRARAKQALRLADQHRVAMNCDRARPVSLGWVRGERPSGGGDRTVHFVALGRRIFDSVCRGRIELSQSAISR